MENNANNRRNNNYNNNNNNNNNNYYYNNSGRGRGNSTNRGRGGHNGGGRRENNNNNNNNYKNNNNRPKREFTNRYQDRSRDSYVMRNDEVFKKHYETAETFLPLCNSTGEKDHWYKHYNTVIQAVCSPSCSREDIEKLHNGLKKLTGVLEQLFESDKEDFLHRALPGLFVLIPRLPIEIIKEKAETLWPLLIDCVSETNTLYESEKSTLFDWLLEMQKSKSLEVDLELQITLKEQLEKSDEAFRQQPIFPTKDEIEKGKIEVDEGDHYRPHEQLSSLHNHLKHQFRLLRQNFLNPVVEQIQLLRRENPDTAAATNTYERNKKKKPLRKYMFTHRGMMYTREIEVVDVLRIEGDASKIQWDQRLLDGNMLIISASDRFKDGNIVFGCVKRLPDFSTDRKGQKAVFSPTGDFQIGFIVAAEQEQRSRFEEMLKRNSVFYGFETTDLFVPYHRTLVALQKTKIDNINEKMVNVLLKGKDQITTPSFMENTSINSKVSLSSVFKCNHNKQVDVNDEEAFNATLTPWSEELENELNEGDGCIHALDTSQREAIRCLLTSNVAVIQGPPGTGKSFIARKYVQFLTANRCIPGTFPLLLIGFKNNAVDSVLGHIYKFFDENRVCRLGRSKDVTLARFELRYGDIRKGYGKNKAEPQAMKVLQNCDTISKLINEINDKCNELAEPPQLPKLKDPKIPLPKYSRNYVLKTSRLQRDETEHRNEIKNKLKQDVDALENAKKKFFGGGRLELLKTVVEKGNEMLMQVNKMVPQEAANIIEKLQGVLTLPLTSREYPPTAESLPLSLESLFDIFSLPSSMRGQISTKEKQTPVTSSKPKESVVVNDSDHDNGEDEEEEFEGQIETSGDVDYSVSLTQLGDIIQKKSITSADQIVSFRESFFTCCRALLRKCKELACQKVKESEEDIRNYYTELYAEKLKEMDLIVGTTSGVLRYLQALRRANIRIIIAEEAAEIMESHILCALTKTTSQLVLVGDPMQLRPKLIEQSIANSKQHEENVLSYSLQERLLCIKTPYTTITTQRRMHPDIACLVKPYYERPPIVYKSVCIEDHPATKRADRVPYFKSEARVIFINHEEDEIDDDDSPYNNWEANAALQIAQYIGSHEHPEDDPNKQPNLRVTILSFYKGQVRRIKALLENIKPGKQAVPRIRTIDEFQGDEDDFIILSTVRTKKSTPFTKNLNRTCVALSRARRALIVLGNSDIIEKNGNDMWKTFLEKTNKDSKIDVKRGCKNYFLAQCPVHGAELYQEHNAVDLDSKLHKWNLKKQRFCKRKCGKKFACGHSCTVDCHGDSPCSCSRTCEKKLGCTHQCTLTCSHTEPCKCSGKDKRSFTVCGHKTVYEAPCNEASKIMTAIKAKDPRLHKASCMTEVNRILNKQSKAKFTTCQKPCGEKMSCGHECNRLCHVFSQEHQCSERCSVERFCEHPCACLCSDDSTREHLPHSFCTKECTQTLRCGHACEGVCSHECKCEKPCKFVCNHHSHHDKQCQCGTCTFECNKDCVQKECQHQQPTSSEPKTCKKRCWEVCDGIKLKCDHRCEKVLRCGHKCFGLCGEKCPHLCPQCYLFVDGDDLSQTDEQKKQSAGKREKSEQQKNIFQTKWIRLNDDKYDVLKEALETGTLKDNKELCDVVGMGNGEDRLPLFFEFPCGHLCFASSVDRYAATLNSENQQFTCLSPECNVKLMYSQTRRFNTLLKQIRKLEIVNNQQNLIQKVEDDDVSNKTVESLKKKLRTLKAHNDIREFEDLRSRVQDVDVSCGYKVYPCSANTLQQEYKWHVGSKRRFCELLTCITMISKLFENIEGIKSFSDRKGGWLGTNFRGLMKLVGEVGIHIFAKSIPYKGEEVDPFLLLKNVNEFFKMAECLLKSESPNWAWLKDFSELLLNAQCNEDITLHQNWRLHA